MDWGRPGFRAVAVYRFGALLRDRKRGVLSRTLSVLYRCMFRYIRNHYGIELPASTIVGRRLMIGHQSGIVIHPNAVIGDDCVILQNCTLGAPSRVRHHDAPKLGNRVELACNVAIIGKVVIGDDVHIGPNVTVMTNISAGTTVIPSTPRLIKNIGVTATQFRPRRIVRERPLQQSRLSSESLYDPMTQKND